MIRLWVIQSFLLFYQTTALNIGLPENKGISYCLNKGIESSAFDLIAYLPADDVYHRDHLETLTERLIEVPDAVLAYSGVRYHYNRYTTGI